MMRPFRAAVTALVLCAGLGPAAEPSIKTGKVAPPKEVPEAARKLLGEESIQFSDDKGKLLAEFWFRKEVPVRATEAQIKNGLTYQEIPQTALLGVVKLHEASTEGARQRFRPVMMTSFAFILGLLPLVVATGASELARRGVGTPVFGGMLVASLIDIFAIPPLYVTFQALRERLKGKAGTRSPAHEPAPH